MCASKSVLFCFCSFRWIRFYEKKNVKCHWIIRTTFIKIELRTNIEWFRSFIQYIFFFFVCASFTWCIESCISSICVTIYWLFIRILYDWNCHIISTSTSDYITAKLTINFAKVHFLSLHGCPYSFINFNAWFSLAPKHINYCYLLLLFRLLLLPMRSFPFYHRNKVEKKYS